MVVGALGPERNRAALGQRVNKPASQRDDLDRCAWLRVGRATAPPWAGVMRARVYLLRFQSPEEASSL